MRVGRDDSVQATAGLVRPHVKTFPIISRGVGSTCTERVATRDIRAVSDVLLWYYCTVTTQREDSKGHATMAALSEAVSARGVLSVGRGVLVSWAGRTGALTSARVRGCQPSAACVGVAASIGRIRSATFTKEPFKRL